MSKKVEWLQAISLITGTAVAIAKTVIQYNEFKREQGTLEYTRELQRRAWDKVIAGELAEAKVGEMTIRSVQSEKSATNTTDNSTTSGANAGATANAGAPSSGGAAASAQTNAPPREGA